MGEEAAKEAPRECRQIVQMLRSELRHASIATLAAHERKVMEECRGIAVARIHLVPGVCVAAGRQVGRDQSGLSRTGWRVDPHQWTCACAVQAREQPFARHRLMGARTGQLRERGRPGHQIIVPG